MKPPPNPHQAQARSGIRAYQAELRGEAQPPEPTPAPAALAARFAPLTVAGLPIVRGGYVWDEAQRRNVWRDEAVTVVMFDKAESGGMKA